MLQNKNPSSLQEEKQRNYGNPREIRRRKEQEVEGSHQEGEQEIYSMEPLCKLVTRGFVVRNKELMSEWKSKCSCCGKSGDHMFARIFYKKIKGKWQWLCPTCWVEN